MTTKYFSLSLLLIVSALDTLPLFAQSTSTTSIGISLLDEHVGLPFESFGDQEPAIHPGFALSVERRRERVGAYQFSRVIQLGYYYHEDNEQVAFLALKPRLSLFLGSMLDLHLVPGLGYARSFPTQPSYALQSGEYAARRNPGKGHFMPSLGVGIGLRLQALTSVPLTLFARHESFVLFPSAHTLTHAGIAIAFQ